MDVDAAAQIPEPAGWSWFGPVPEPETPAPAADAAPDAKLNGGLNGSASNGNGAVPPKSPPESPPESPSETTQVIPVEAVPIPLAPVESPDSTIVMGRTIGPITPVGDAAEPAGADEEPTPKRVQVVPLRPVQTEAGYRSVYSDLTRTTTGTVVRAVLRGTGELCITLGVIFLLFAAYEVWGKTVIIDHDQHNLDRQLDQQWAGAAPGASPSTSSALGTKDLPPPPGGAIARLYIPRMGKQWVVVQGVQPADIRYAPGHYPSSAMPGQPGNFSVAGHRIPAIFWDLDQVRDGDPIVVETRTTWYVYHVSSIEVVSPHAVQVVAPVPNKPGVKPTPDQHYLTLTTCNPKYNNYQRLVVHGTLDTAPMPHTGPRPAELGA
jgi:sortase A